MRRLVKVCGMRSADNIRQVESLGIDWMGFIFYEPSPRHVSQVPEYMPKRCRRVGVFVNASIPYITERVRDYGLDIVQLHGTETTDFITDLRSELPSVCIIKAISVSTITDLSTASLYDMKTDYLLFETKCTTYGGSGQQFDWSIIDHYHGTTPFILAGGIGPDDAKNINRITHPQFAGIDINSRFELAPALKDITKLQKFLNSYEPNK